MGPAPDNLARKMAKEGFKILGTKAHNIDRAEDRESFQVYWIVWRLANHFGRVFQILRKQKFALNVGFPVLVRPSYVLSGSAMKVCFNTYELESFWKKQRV